MEPGRGFEPRILKGTGFQDQRRCPLGYPGNHKHIASEFNCAELWLTDFSPVMGYATGTGVLAVAFYTAAKEQKLAA